jgi:hypothetical protein
MSAANPAAESGRPSVELLTIPETALLLDVGVTGVHQLVKDGQLVAIREPGGRRAIPRAFVAGGTVVKGLRAVVTLLRDNKYTDDEIVDWLFRPDDSLPGTPIQALADNRGTEVRRRAQAAGY